MSCIHAYHTIPTQMHIHAQIQIQTDAHKDADATAAPDAEIVIDNTTHMAYT